MKIRKRFAAAAVLLMISGIFGKLTVKADSVPDEIPMFEACVKYSPQGWIVEGVFKDFADDTILVQPMCSTDGETYVECGQEWNLQWLGSEDEGELARLQDQRCLYGSEEPLKSYLAKELNRFYIKLRVVRESGIVYETQTAVIDRGEQQPVPPESELAARFAPGMFVREGRPPDIQCYGRYQITVSEDAAGEEISAFLPDTLPVEIQLQRGSEYIGNDILNCPVKWKPLKLPQLTAGESVTVPDAAEEIVIPAGTVLNTQTGIYQLNESMSMNQYGIMNEVRLVLNVVAKGGQPAGVLAEQNYGLELSFQLKPTGASSIRAYTLTEGEAEWTELSGLSLTDAINTQPSTANSGYTVLLGRDQEPYRSYWKAQEAGEEPTPFFVAFKMEGGVYDGSQFVLAWPDTYELPPDLPKVEGSGGNEGNVGSDNRNDSTEEGQRPGLPQNPEDGQAPELPDDREDKLPEPGLSEDRKDKLPESGLFDDREDKLPEPGLSEDRKDKLPEFELLEGLIKEADPFMIIVKRPKNERPENELPETGTEFFRQQENMVHMQDGAAVQITAKNNVEREEGIPDSVLNTEAAMDTASFGYEQKSAQPDIQEKPVRRIKNADNRMFLLVIAGAAVLVCAGIAGFFLKRK